MEREEVIAIVTSHQEALQKMGVRSLELFGSVARGSAGRDSDVDFLVQFNGAVGLFGLFRVQHYLEEILGRPVDLGTERALREHLREPVLQESIRVL
jgi:uncharacterized protein